MAQKITPVSTERALLLCARSVSDDKHIIKTMLENQEAEAFVIGECCFITRFEISEHSKELVVMCAEGKDLVNAAKALRAIAKKHGCTSARMHTKRPALQRLARECGWVQHEIIFKMVV